ncbi:unknown [Ruminococcus sp. CAG:624]|nr:unknown [Ruminococcus sp. CAG:624]
MSKFRNFAVAVVTLISATNTFGSFYLSQKSTNSNNTVVDESLDTSAIQEDSSLSLENTTGDDTTSSETATSASSIVTTTVIDTENTDANETTVIQTTTQKQEPIEKYEISSIAKLNNGDINSFQSYAIDTDANTIYYIDRNLDSYYADVTYYIYKYDIQSKSIELVKELPYSTNLYPICLTYNQFDNKMYCFAGGGESLNSLSYFQVESNEFHRLNTNGNRNFLSDYNHFDDTNYRSFYFVSATEFVIELEQGDYHSRLYLYNTVDDSFTSGSIGVYSANRKNETDTPFMYKDNYYWLCSRSGGFSIVKSQKLFYPLQSGDNTYYGDNLGQFSTNDGWIAGNVYNGAVYLMKNDFSIYKVDLDILEQVYNEQSQTEEKNNLIVSPDKDENLQNALTLIIDGKEIKQTGVNNLTTVKFFSFVSDDSILVYDDFDKNYKLISAIK